MSTPLSQGQGGPRHATANDILKDPCFSVTSSEGLVSNIRSIQQTVERLENQIVRDYASREGEVIRLVEKKVQDLVDSEEEEFSEGIQTIMMAVVEDVWIPVRNEIDSTIKQLSLKSADTRQEIDNLVKVTSDVEARLFIARKIISKVDGTRKELEESFKKIQKGVTKEIKALEKGAKESASNRKELVDEMNILVEEKLMEARRSISEMIEEWKRSLTVLPDQQCSTLRDHGSDLAISDVNVVSTTQPDATFTRQEHEGSATIPIQRALTPQTPNAIIDTLHLAVQALAASNSHLQTLTIPTPSTPPRDVVAASPSTIDVTSISTIPLEKFPLLSTHVGRLQDENKELKDRLQACNAHIEHLENVQIPILLAEVGLQGQRRTQYLESRIARLESRLNGLEQPFMGATSIFRG